MLRLSFALGLVDIRLQYRRSTLGPLWLALTMLAQIAVIGILFSRLFDSNLFEYLLYLGAGLVIWLALTGTVNESATALILSGSLIKQVALPPQVHVFRVVFRNFLLFCHNAIAIIPFYFLAGAPLAWSTLAVIPGILFVLLNLSWIAVSSSIIGARYRDVPAIISAFLVIGFYVTPILWNVSQVDGTAIAWIVWFNPFTHMVQIVREPIIGNPVPLESLLFMMFTGVLGWLFTQMLIRWKGQFIPFWV